MTRAIVRTLLSGSVLCLGLLPGAGDASASYPCSSTVSATTCRDDHFRVTCQHEAACAPILQSGFQASFNSATPVQHYLDQDDRNDLVSGRKKRHLISSAKIIPPGGLTSYAGLEARAHALAQSSSVTPSPSYMRTPAWISNGAAIASCDEYVYEKYYDYMRFVDAANSCHDDAECVVDMAYTTFPFMGTNQPVTPALADRVLHGRGDPEVPAVELDDIPLTNGLVPKNGFYTGAIFLTPALVSHLSTAFPASAAALSQLAARVHGSSNYYRWGVPSLSGPAPVMSYADEWDYHRDMRARTLGIAATESVANQRRVAAFEGLFASFAEQAYCWGVHGVVNCTHLPEVAPTNHLLERIGGDPFVRSAVLGNDTLRKQALSFTLGEMPFRLTPNGNALLSQQQILDIGMPAATLPGGISYVLPPGNPSPSVDPSPLWTAGSIGADLNGMWATTPPALDTTSATPLLDCDADMAQDPDASAYRHAACLATNALLREWGRDNPGCLDVGYAGCDWHASMFVDRFATTQLYMPERTHDYNECVRWTKNSFNVYVGLVPPESRLDFQALESFIDVRREEFNTFDAPRELDVNDRVISFGQSKSDSVELGDQDSFGGGYAYNAGWSSTPMTRQNNQICRLDFAADASFQAWATGLGQKTSIVDVQAHVKANEGNLAGATFQRSIVVVGAHLITPNDTQPVNINGVMSTALAGRDEATEIYANTVPLGYGLYVDVAIDAEYSVGTVFLATASVPATGCMTQGGMNALAGVMPYARASVVGSVYGGWLGIVEAGLEAQLDLLKATLPITAQGQIIPGADPQIRFDLDGDLTLTTLSGHVDMCGCFLVFCGCQELLSWPGQDLGTFAVLTPVHDQVALTGM